MLLRAANISRSFESTQALMDVSIEFDVAEVHALVGENGAGKSTLFKILSGYVPMEAGTIIYKEQPFYPDRILERRDSRVVLVDQELNINMSIGIAENIFFDRMRRYATLGIINQKKLNENAQKILDELDSGINVRKGIDGLNLGQLKIVQVAQALSKEPEVIFLDESTAYLNNYEIQTLFRVIHKLKERGLAIGFVSHHLDELEMVADKITILKDGRKVGCYKVGELSLKEIEALMVGRSQDFAFSISDISDPHDTIFRANNVNFLKEVKNISFVVRKGEILGFAGLKGAGGETLLELMVGEKRLSSGKMEFNNRKYAPKTPHDAFSNGMSYLPASRQSEGLITEFSIKENIIMTNYPKKGIFLDNAGAISKVKSFIEFFNIRAKNMNQSCKSLSGGNMQKVAFSKSLSPSPEVLLLNNPTRGIDVASRYEVYTKIRELVSDRGLTIIILSEDLIELIGLSDRILVFRKGIISKEFLRNESPTESDILSYMI